MSPKDISKLPSLVQTRVRVEKGDTLFRLGDPQKAMYAVRAGTFRTCLDSEDGRNQVVGFHLPGEMIGLDSLMQPGYQSTATALEDTSLCVIPSDRLKAWSVEQASLRVRMMQALAEQIQQERQMVRLLGSTSADERVSGFLLGLSERFRARGFAASEFILRMTREDIGSYLGLKLETVSRALTRLASSGLITVRSRHITIRNHAGLAEMARAGTAPSRAEPQAHFPIPHNASAESLATVGSGTSL